MIRGMDAKQEQSVRQLARDTRPLGVRVAEVVAKPECMLIFSSCSIVGSFFYPWIIDIAAVLCTGVFAFSMTRKQTLPFRIPRSAHLKDYNDLIPGSTKPKIGDGIAFFGNDFINLQSGRHGRRS